MPAPTNLSAIERDVVASTLQAIESLGERLTALWPDEYPAHARARQVLEDVFEHAIQFETACILRERLRERGSPWPYVSWELGYSESYMGGRLDLVVGPDRERVEPGSGERLGIELKVVGEGDQGLIRAASDILKLAWAQASARYVLLIGPMDAAHLCENLMQAARGGHSDWDQDELKAARGMLGDLDSALRLAQWEATVGDPAVVVALVEVRYTGWRK